VDTENVNATANLHRLAGAKYVHRVNHYCFKLCERTGDCKVSIIKFCENPASIDAKVINGTDKALSALPPFPVHLAYHWLDAETREVVVFDGQRNVDHCARSTR